MEHDQLYEAAIESIRRVHADTDVPIRTTLESLKSIREELDVFIDAVEHDVSREE